jgi:hypothetical protein
MLHRHAANVKVTTVLGSIPASSVGRSIDQAVTNMDHKGPGQNGCIKILCSKFYTNQVKFMINEFIAYILC